MKKLRIGVLGSGKGSNFQAIVEAMEAKGLAVDVRLVLSDVPGAGILRFAREKGFVARELPPSRFKTRLDAEVEALLSVWLQEAGVELVVLAGYMRMVKEPLLAAFPGRIVNIHPSLLPQFPGLAAWRQALDAKVSVTGCTVHWVDAGMDTGPIIAQREVPVLEGDTPETLHARIQVAEHALYPDVLERLAATLA